MNKSEIKIINSKFIKNHAGQKASAINLMNITRSTLILDNLTISGNTPSYSFYEEQDLTPFYNILTMKKYKLNYF